MFSRFFDFYLRGVTRFPKLTLGVLAIVLIAALIGLPNFKLDASSDSLTLEHDKDLDFYREVIKQYQSGDFLVVTYRPEASLFTQASLQTLQALRDELAQIDGVVSINSILDVPLLYSPVQPLREMVKNPRTLLTPGMDYDMAKKEFLSSPVYKDLILAPNGQTTALQLNLAVDDKAIDLYRTRDALSLKQDKGDISAEEVSELEKVRAELRAHTTEEAQQSRERVAQIRAVVEKYRDHAQIYVGGLTMITADMIRFIQNDLVIFGSAVLLFMIAVLAVIFRSIRFVVIPMVTCITAVLLVLGYVSWVDWRLTVISSNFAALLLIISLAIIIHLIVRYREFAQEQPEWTQRELVMATAKFMVLPCLYTVLTSIVAFVSLVVSNIRPVIDFGWLMTIGLGLAFVLAFTVLPASLVLLRKQNGDSQGQATDVTKPKKPATYYFARAVEKHGNVILAVSLVIGLASAWGVSRLQVENRFIDYFHKSTEIYKGLSVIDKDLGGTTSLDIVINNGDQDTVSSATYADEADPFAEADAFDEADPFETLQPITEADPFAEADPFSEHGDDASSSYWMTVAGLRKVEQVHDYLESLPEVGKVQSLATLYKVGKDINGSLNDFELAIMQKSLPEEVSAALVAPYLAAKEDQTRITMRIHDGYPGLQRAELVERMRDHINSMELFEPEKVRFTGLLVLYNNMLQSLFSSQIATLGTVLLGIFIMFIVLFRSLKVALVAIVPTILAAVSILGFMGIFGLPLDMMTITVAAITVGIGVDNTIHYVHRFRRELMEKGDYTACMYIAHGSIGRAMFYTSVIIIFGFSIMVLSAFIPTIYFGLLTGLAMFMSLLGALLLLPRLLLLFKPFNVPQPALQ
ncbi:efflux RND transporter permease subunit [Teredinibacter turnerae]|uniref:efflux RND transporter permease subunit n=1 Tax=Teredinibacter turnerae TaxID=2426 RepID=UPI000377F05C|nr:MMPL family transporter [Teredinibacter turnerae]